MKGRDILRARKLLGRKSPDPTEYPSLGINPYPDAGKIFGDSLDKLQAAIEWAQRQKWAHESDLPNCPTDPCDWCREWLSIFDGCDTLGKGDA